MSSAAPDTRVATPAYDAFDVPVAGGSLHVGRWSSGTPTGPGSLAGAAAAGAAVGSVSDSVPVVAVHGVTANHLAWLPVARAGIDLVAPDLRGRGGSADLDGPAGMDAHATDLLALLDHLDVPRALLVGHSMGGFAVAAFAAAHPERVAGVLLVDGGLPLPAPPPGTTPDDAIAAVIGPAAQRLAMSFASQDAYLDFWREHPALAPAWSPDLEAYFAYDLVGTAPQLRSSVSLQAVREDSVDLLDVDRICDRVRALPAGTTFLRATGGMMGEPGGLYPVDHVAALDRRCADVAVRDVPDVNHYTLVMSDPGAAVVAAAVADLAASGR